MGHVVINLPVVILIVMARLSGLDANLEEAAMDLGATYLGTQWRDAASDIAGPVRSLSDVVHHLVR